MRDDLDDRVRIHAALADRVRLGIVDELSLSDRAPRELGERFGVRSNLLAHHLDVLEGAGLVERVTSHGDRRRRYVRLVADRVTVLADQPLLRADGVVFVCTHNAARSQLAAALWNLHSAVGATSAGTEPADRVHPEAVRAARRRSLDLTGAVPRRLEPSELEGRLVVTVCDLAHEELDALRVASDRAGLPVLHWSVPDPAATGRRADFDAVTDALDGRVRALAASVTHP